MERSTEERIGFVGLELSKGKPIRWPEVPFDPSTESVVNHILEVHSVICGKNAVRDEENLVQVSVFHQNGEVTTSPLAYVTRGSCNQILLNLRFTSPVMFSLVEGAGPVHILATHCIAPSSIDDDDDLEEEELDEEDELNGLSYPPPSGADNDFKGLKLMGNVDGSLEPLSLKRKKITENGQGDKKRRLAPNETSESEEELNDELANDL